MQQHVCMPATHRSGSISTHLSQWTYQQAVQMDSLNPVVAALFWLTALCALDTGLPCLQ